MNNSVLCYLQETCKEFGEKSAVTDKNGSLSFNELKGRAQVVASEIWKLTGRRKCPVFVYLPKSCDLVVSLLGALMSGDFYTPTDVRFPFDKVKKIIDELCPEVAVSDNDNIERLIECGISRERIINIDELNFDSDVSEYLEENIADKIIDTDLAYILFTSGSTGVPKGVCITHRSIIDYIDWAKNCFGIDDTCVIGNQAPFYFDNSTLDLYLMLSTGATLNIIPEQLFSFPARLMEYVYENGINTIFWVPSVFVNIANADAIKDDIAYSLKNILFAGEVMPNKYLNYWRKKIPNAQYANLYGPTEITVDCTYYIVNREFNDDDPLPIGKACSNTEIMLLDSDRNVIKDKDIIGEICVRGTSLSVGYWKNPEKTAEAFIQNPENKVYDEKIYCTGDLAHYNDLGELMYDGRKDSQIKHMGYRIELGEIETAVLGIDGIETACVLYNVQDKKIVLFYVGYTEKVDIRKALFQVLPKYMVPGEYVQLDNLPYNDNGKIDRGALKREYFKA